MTYDHSVKVNGKWFKAGEDISASLVLNAAKPTTQAIVDTDKKKVEEEKAEKPASTTKRSYTKRK